MNTDTGKYEVLVVYPWLPHYRYGVFKEMERSKWIDYHFASDLESEGNIATIPPELLRNHTRLRNIRIWRGLWQFGLISHLLKTRYDGVIFLGDAATLSTWAAALLCKFQNISVYFWTIGWHRPEFGLKRHLRMYFYKLANRLLIYGDTGREIGARLGFPRDRMTVIYNSHQSMGNENTLLERKLEDSYFRDLKTPIIGAVIRLSPSKNLPLLLRAAGILRRRQAYVTVILAGEGPMRQELIQIAVEEGIDLRMLGPIYHPDDLAAIYSNLSLTVVPSTAGLTTIQSLSYGVPVISDDDISTQAPESEAIIPGTTGDTYESGNPAALADKIQRWLSFVSEEQQRQISEACKAEVDAKWNPSSQASLIDNAIRPELQHVEGIGSGR